MTARGRGEVCGSKAEFKNEHGIPNHNTWNANSWPYESSRVLHGMANVLHDFPAAAHPKPAGVSKASFTAGAAYDSAEYTTNNHAEAPASAPASAAVTVENYWSLLQQFARQHTQSSCALDTASPAGSGHIGENIHPHLGYWNTREWRYLAQNEEEINKGKDYFHSSFIDLIITGLLGFKATRTAAAGPLLLTASPLIPAARLPPYFAIDGIRSAAHDIALIWDADGTRYAKGKGMAFVVDGVVVASRATVGHLNVTLPYAPPTPPEPTPPKPTPPPAPPPPPPPEGYQLLPKHVGTYCCDQSECTTKNNTGSTFLYSGAKTRQQCMAMCTANTRCNYVTEYENGARYHCFNEQYCNTTGKYVDTPNPTCVQTWQKVPPRRHVASPLHPTPPPRRPALPLEPPASPVYTHGWDTVGDMLFAHGGNKSVLSDDAHAYLAKSYSMVAFASCYGSGRGTNLTQEDAALISAKKLRALNPGIKNVFYFKSHLESQVLGCSSANATYRKNREAWVMKGDGGKPISNGKFGFFDVRQNAVQDWWVGHLVDLLSEADATTGKPYIDAVYVDGCPGEHTGFRVDPPAGITKQEWEVYSTALYAMVARLQAALNANGHRQLAVCNGLDDAYSLQHNTAQAPHHWGEVAGAMSDHFAVYNFINKTSGAWVPAPTADLLFNIVRSPLVLGKKTVQIKGWPGPLVGPRKWISSVHTPNTTAEIQAAMAENWNTALALFLLVAEENMWWGYSWFWGAEDYVPVGPSHTCPDNFYPQLKCQLGAPAGPPRRVNASSALGGGGGGGGSLVAKDGGGSGGGWKYEREYAHASVKVDLESRENTKVIWNTAACAKFNQ